MPWWAWLVLGAVLAVVIEFQIDAIARRLADLERKAR
jgi:hypothetical protein